jgi:hypothetical protein
MSATCPRKKVGHMEGYPLKLLGVRAGEPSILLQGNAQDYVHKYVMVGSSDYISI